MKGVGGAPKMWAPAIEDLKRDGFFKLPYRRTSEDQVKAILQLEKHD